MVRTNNYYLDDIFDFSLKLDGAGIRFGITSDCKPFIETSRSGPIFKHGAFSEYAYSKNLGGESLSRAKRYDDIFRELCAVAESSIHFRDVKVIGELLYMPFATRVDEKHVRFIKTPYYEEALNRITFGFVGAVEASTGKSLSPHIQRSVFKSLCNGPIAQFSCVDTKLHPRGLKLTESDMITKYHFGRAVLAHEFSNRYVLGKYMEGIVVDTPFGLYKINTNRY